MEDELERIKYVLDMFPTKDDKIAFLLRQVEWLVKSRNSYRNHFLKENEKTN